MAAGRRGQRRRVYLVGSELHSGFAFDQGCIDLHDDRLYRVGTAPALKAIRQTVNPALSGGPAAQTNSIPVL